MAKFAEKEQAIQLRVQGRSINDIALALTVSKSTVSHWCRDISLSTEAMRRIIKRSNVKSTAALLTYTEGLRRKRQHNIHIDQSTGKKQLG